MGLAQENCIPCRDGGPTLDDRQTSELLGGLKNWRVTDSHHLQKHLSFAEFQSALDWVNAAGALCEQQGHHADFSVGWGYVDIDLFTHKASGLTRSDFVLAAKFDRIGAKAPYEEYAHQSP